MRGEKRRGRPGSADSACGVVAGLRLLAGLVALAAVVYLHWVMQMTMELAFRLARGFPLDGTGPLDVLVPGRIALYPIAALSAWYAGGVAGALLLSRRASGRLLLLAPVAFVLLMVLLLIAFSLRVAGVGREEATADVIRWLDGNTFVVGHLVVAAVLVAVAWYRSSRVELVA